MLSLPTAVGPAALAGVPEVVLQSDSDDTLGVLALFGIGLFLVYHGFGQWKRMRLMQDTPTEKVRSAAVGRTELTGVAKPIDGGGTADRPFTDGECLVATWKIEEWEEDHDDDHGSNGHWQTVDSGTILRPFHVDDGTGRMRVEPTEDATFEISDRNRTTFRVGAGRSPPPEVREFFERQYEDGDDDGLLDRIFDGGPGTRGSDKRRYKQSVIPPGERLYLLGGAQPTADAAGSNADRLVLGPDEASEEFIVADQDEEELVSDYRWAAPAEIAGGIALSAAMLYVLIA